MNHERNALILFFISIFSLTLLCSIKVCRNNPRKKPLIKESINIKSHMVENNTNEKNVSKNEKTIKKYISNPVTSKIKEKKFIPLKLGSNGNEVKALQQKLNKFGYKINLDGIFGHSTEIAIYDFQKRNDLARDAIVGKSTLKKLDLEPTEKTMYNPKANIFSSVNSSNYFENFINKKNSNSITDYYIWVNTNTPKTYIFKGYNHHWKLIRTLPCTVGKSSTPTIKGTFSIGNKGESFIVRNNPKLMCKYFTQINGDYLFHTILLNRNGSIANGILGAKLSHGCIRLSINDAKFIYYNIPKKTTVYIN
ncbi:murein L,D-transpeptidase [Clostridium botulinum C]|uniref:L,D-transpeptidase family protein n=1 Tax=Clostridium botulinum TaxID=1491 RepID=UPI001E455AB4|nr:L,D-transpeptidase family protein [Clostridium botulinum]MCD3216067.1 murein L,D-transpeptidase [Clostridium botulinum C]